MTRSTGEITIAITVYDRRQYLAQAIASALNQTVRARVLVVEDCGPDATLAAFVRQEFGPGLEYVRNPRRRGLFGNWNACLDLCETPWMAILHDDDFLEPHFVEAMLDLQQAEPGCDLYIGLAALVDEQGALLPARRQPGRPITGMAARAKLDDMLYNPFLFPGHLFRVAAARQGGGFRETSIFCGDWEMWAKLTAKGGAALTSRVVAYVRTHGGWDRGTNKVARNGKLLPAAFAQHKRILALMPPGPDSKFDRARFLKHRWISIRELLRYSHGFSPRMRAYHFRLLLLSPPPDWRYAWFQKAARIGGPAFISAASRLWNWFRP
jgi:glycosyltransferase involved in cell wall biosynthesis